MRLAFPAGQLVAMSMAGGPLPARYRGTVQGQPPGVVLELDYTADELLAMRRWWVAQPSHPSAYQQRAREACVMAIYLAFEDGRLCLGCGRALPSTHNPVDPPFCPDCVRRA